MKFGFDAKKLSADYNYDRSFYKIWLEDSKPFNEEYIDYDEKGTELGFYLSNKFRIKSSIIAEAGLR